MAGRRVSFLSGSQIALLPSILNADFRILAQQIHTVEEAGVEGIHLDIMDGHFVPNISFGPDIVTQINKMTDLPMDVHLMISNPEFFIQRFIDAGADNVTIHQETCKNPLALIKTIRTHGSTVGIALNPETPVETVIPLLKEIQLVLIMSVHPGFGGQVFIAETLPKISKLKQLIEVQCPDLMIEVDGGLDNETIPKVIERGATALVVGSAIFKQPDIELAIYKFHDLIKSYELQG